MTATVLVWDGEGPIPSAPGQSVLLWSSYATTAGSLSIPSYLDANGQALRARYLTFIGDLGRQQIAGKTVIQHLEAEDGFSFWWMSQLAEKSPFKSSRLTDCLRVLALEDILRKDIPISLRIHSSDRLLVKAVSELCSTLGIGFSLANVPRAPRDPLLPRIYKALPWRVRGLLSLRHTLRRWPLRSLAAPRWFSGPNSIFFCSYFFNLDREKSLAGRFVSHQWEALPGALQKEGRRINWLHHMLLTPGIRSVGAGLALARMFNQNAENEGCHSFVESQLSVGLLWSSLVDWWRLGICGSQLQPLAQYTPAGSAVNLWHFLQDDWNTSVRGPIALSNCVWRRLFDRALSSLPHQAVGCYLWENQGWETAFLHAWRRHGHGRIIGVPHATIAFWHLNNFEDPRELVLSGEGAKPRPDALAINGPSAWRMLTESGYPQSLLVKVEALRFQYLARFSRPSPEAPAKRLASGEPLKLLLMGDFTRKQTMAMVDCLRQALGLITRPVSITFKSHPACPFDQQDVSDMDVEYTNQPLADILPNFALAFSSNTSSAGLDALLAGLPVAVFLDGAHLNHSPLRGVAGAQFVRDAQELAAVIDSGNGQKPMPADQFFWMDEKLSRWHSLLELHAPKIR